jgi:hypothetical protein
MRRRDVVLGGLAAAVLPSTGRGQSPATQSKADDLQQRIAEERARMLATFPFERITTSGRNAVATWERLRDADRGAPVILGDDDSIALIMELWGGEFDLSAYRRSVQDTLDAAARIKHPDDLVRLREVEEQQAAEFLKTFREEHPEWPGPTIIVMQPDGTWRQLGEEESRAAFYAEQREPEVGEWPQVPDVVDGPTVLQEYSAQWSEPDGRAQVREPADGAHAPADGPSGILEALREFGTRLDEFSGQWRLRQTVDIALIPTDDWTAIPAFFQFGAWNACPPPEYHVAALRSWRDRYGAELVGLSHDVLELRVAGRPASRAIALDLAREQYAYCNDIVDQGTGTLSGLAASLMASDWWHFWWD